MIHRALRADLQGNYLLADAWFGSKAMIRLCKETALTVILRMKKSKLKYRISNYLKGEIIQRDMDIKSLYKHAVRKQWKTAPGQRFQAKVVDRKLNLAFTDKEDVQWTNVFFVCSRD